MPDISMCNGNCCFRKESCYRFLAEPNPGRQSYAAFDEDPDNCEHFIEAESKSQMRRLNILTEEK